MHVSGEKLHLSGSEIRRLITWLHLIKEGDDYPSIVLVQGKNTGIGAPIYAYTNECSFEGGRWVKLHDEGEW